MVMRVDAIVSLSDSYHAFTIVYSLLSVGLYLKIKLSNPPLALQIDNQYEYVFILLPSWLWLYVFFNFIRNYLVSGGCH